MTTLKTTIYGFLALAACIGMWTAPSEIARWSFVLYVLSMIALASVAVRDIADQFKRRRFP